jgi:hydroxymethylglutaryl-CoA reductase (NADPH)
MVDVAPCPLAVAHESLRVIVRDPDNDYTVEVADRQRRMLAERTGVDLQNVGTYSFDPSVLAGNVENFIGVAQVPIGVAGPLRINGEHARGEFLIPLATTEGALIASYNRGMRLLNECGGVTTTVVEERMQRGPVFSFASAAHARDFGHWLTDFQSIGFR